MTVRIISRNLAAAEELVEDAVPAKPLFQQLATAEAEAWWQAFPASDVKPKPCKFCGDKLIHGCRGTEQARCLNFYTAERRKQKAS